MATARKTSSAGPARKTAAKTATKKTAKKTASKTAGGGTTRRTPAKRPVANDASDNSTKNSTINSTDNGRAPKKPGAGRIARSAAEQLAELTGRVPESVIGIERGEGLWAVDLEVVESRRIPDSTDVLATYRVQMDEDGELVGYHRARRYIRGRGGEGEGGSQ
jgi:hypothetical protein